MNYRDLTYGRELRAYTKELSQATALYERAMQTKRGRIVFIAGQPKSGRTDLLMSIGRHLGKLKPTPHLMSGSFHSHQYTVTTKELGVTDAYAATAEVIAFASKLPIPGNPSGALDFLAQLMQTGGALHSLKQNHEPPPDWQDEIKRSVRKAAQTQPVVYLVDNLDHAGDLWLPWLLTDLATEIDRDLPLLVFVTLEASSKLGEARDDEPIHWKAARELIDRGVAEWWPLTPLTRAEVAAYIGNARPGLAEHLHQVTGGFPRRVVELWHDWQTRQVVWWSDKDDCWQFDQAKRPTLNLVKDVIDDRLKNIFGADDHESLRQAREVLAYGALAGESFAADAVAQALNWADRDELIDFIDDELLLSDENPNGLLLEAEALPFTTDPNSQRPMWRYRFANDLFWLANFQYGLTESELPRTSAALFNALQEIYGDQQRLIAGDMARLARNGGAHDTAQHYQRMWDHGTARDAMRHQGLLMAQADKTAWSFWQKFVAVGLLIQASELIMQSAPVSETAFLLTETWQLAGEIKEKPKQAHAGYLLGAAFQRAGDYEQAVAAYNKALIIFREMRIRDGESACLFGLAEVMQRYGDVDQAARLYDEALIIDREIRNVRGKSACLKGLAVLALERGDDHQAEKRYNEALAIDCKIENQDGESICLAGLAEIALRRGKYDQAENLYDKALVINREIGRRSGEAACLYGKAQVTKSRGNYEQAETLFQQSLALATELEMLLEQTFAEVALMELAKLREAAA